MVGKTLFRTFVTGEKSGSTPNTEKTAGNLSPWIRLRGLTMFEKLQ